ncbi:MAG: hypothetical protein ACFB4I_16525 [Cyanophyceae cyanobacterium]
MVCFSLFRERIPTVEQKPIAVLEFKAVKARSDRFLCQFSLWSGAVGY